RRIAEVEQRKLQDQLIHAQKMEAVGHLAGGIAHDFNNILTAIIGYTNLLRRKLAGDDPSRTFTDHILAASERAARLVKSLLAFSRKQVIEPMPVDLGEIVKGVEKIARTLIGEDIEFAVNLHASATVMADTGQMEQVLLNLCTNARDAMPKGGHLAIETDRVTVDDESRRQHLLDRPGTYGIIAVSDTGNGMDEGVRKQIFEPFFTTKEVGKGTGLGLSIAYGIVRQHNGTIQVYSEPGRGTTFKIYLPSIDAAGAPIAAAEAAAVRGGTETILLAEDESEVRELVAITLREAGYRVIEAVDGPDAERQFAENGSAVSLLLTDLIMPKKNGREVYEQLRLSSPSLNVLFMSGYTADIIRNKGVLDDPMLFISKPIIPDILLKKVREALDGPAGPKA
ncbi:MAG: ATP-binding protein, partial [Nitrospiraceae bacterium]|nr:ATP-binding protein [Nitrospiraceae bacterium]